ncbi:glycosyltransferase [Jannaschia sp. R86511]|uniref:glycosyltransferase n=1 Tax=Jannaschia sp. R86511 TaxID=3093853 RepID=UPI0036D2CFBF
MPSPRVLTVLAAVVVVATAAGLLLPARAVTALLLGTVAAVAALLVLLLRRDAGRARVARRTHDELSTVRARVHAVDGRVQQLQAVPAGVTERQLRARTDELTRHVEALVADAVRSGREDSAAVSEGLRRDVSYLLDRVARQGEATRELSELVEGPLLPGGRASVEPSVLREVLALLADLPRGLVVELGSGRSTLWLAAWAARNAPARVVALDHDAAGVGGTRAALQRQGLADRADVRHAPLVPTPVEGHEQDWYDRRTWQDLEDVVLLLVDAPPAGAPDGQHPALPLLGRRMSPHGVVVLVAPGPQGRQVLDRWTAGRGWTATGLPDEPDVFVLRQVPAGSRALPAATTAPASTTAPAANPGPRARLAAAVATGQGAAALAEVLAAAAGGTASVPLLLDAHAVAREQGDQAAAATLRRALGRLVPPDQQSFHRVVTTLRHSDPEDLATYRATLAAADDADRLDLWRLEQLEWSQRAQQALAEDGGPPPAASAEESAQEVAGRLLPGVPAGPSRLTAVLQAASLCRRWDLVGALAQGARDPMAPREAAVVRRVLGVAVADGELSATVALSGLLDRVGGADDETRERGRTAADQLRLLQEGWPADVPAATRPRPAARPDEAGATDRTDVPDATAATGATDPAAGTTTLYLLGQSLPQRSGGYAIRSHGMATGLRSHGWDLHAVTRYGFPYDLWREESDLRPVPLREEVDGVPYHRLLDPDDPAVALTPLVPYVHEGARRSADLGRRLGARLVHAASLADVGLAGSVAAATLDVPFVYEMRGLRQLLEEARNPATVGSQRHALHDLTELTAARRADRLLVITAALGAEMVRLGVDPDSVVVVPNGVDPARFPPRERDSELAARLGVADRVVVGYAGSLVFYEGLDDLLEAWPRVRRARPEAHLVVVGDGSHGAQLRRHAQRLGLDGSVTFTGRVPHEDVPRYLSLFDVAPFPRAPLRVCELISPLKPFEAMSAGTPVVVSSVAALTEVVHDGVTGRVFGKGDPAALADVLVDLVGDADQRQRLAAAARDWVLAERTWQAVTGRVSQVYRDLLR